MSFFSQKIKIHVSLALLSFFIPVSGPYGSIIGVAGGYDDKSSSSYFGWIDSDGMFKSSVHSDVIEKNPIYSVAINSSGMSIVGGETNKKNEELPHVLYASFVSLSGKVTPVLFPTSENGNQGMINAVAINSSGAAILGGFKGVKAAFDTHTPYFAMVHSDGAVIPPHGSGLPQGKGKILSVAIDGLGSGIIGGYESGNSYMYAGKVEPNGKTSRLIPKEIGGGIRSVAMNEGGWGVLGGFLGSSHSSQFYAACVDPEGHITQVPSESFGFAKGQILCVAINSSQRAMIGGYWGRSDSATKLYAASIQSDGSILPISLPDQKGRINAISVNASGASVIGGEALQGAKKTRTPYAAFIALNGSVTPIPCFDSSEQGAYIHSVSIHDSGIALIGGSQKNSSGENETIDTPYLALVAPNGTLTPLHHDKMFKQGKIWSVSTNSFDSLEPIFEEIIPRSVGLGNLTAEPLFSLSTGILSHHLNLISSVSLETRTAPFLVANCSESMQGSDYKIGSKRLWLSPFGMYGRYKQDRFFPNLKDQSIGAMFGLDFGTKERGMIGLGWAYVSQKVHFNPNIEEASGRQGWVTLYGACQARVMHIEGAIWGGLYQVDDRRTPVLDLISTHSSIKGHIVSPHIKIDVPLQLKKMVFRPFTQWDWANIWQRPIREEGKSGMNLRIRSKYVSLLRSELGVSFSQNIQLDRGSWHFNQKASYINLLPCFSEKTEAYYIDSASTFDLSLFSNQTQHCAGFLCSGSFLPKTRKMPILSATYQGEFGAKRLRHTFGLEVKQTF